MYNLDSNHHQICRAAQQLGCLVVDNAKVKRREGGQLDIWLGFPNNYAGPGLWVWCEIKAGKGKLKPKQARFIAECRQKGLPTATLRSTEDLDILYNAIQNQFQKTERCFK